MTRERLDWQSKAILLMVVPAIGADLVLEGSWWVAQFPKIAFWTFILSAALGILAWKSGSATPAAAMTGGAICCSLMLATTRVPYSSLETALPTVLTLLILTSITTRIGRRKKELLGTVESRSGRKAAQVAANLGMAALIANGAAQAWLMDRDWMTGLKHFPALLAAPFLASLAEAAADTISSELGQLANGQPRLITTFRPVAPGTDGAISLAGTVAGGMAAGIVAGIGTLTLHAGSQVFWLAWIGAMTGLFFDSLLGATLERLGRLNNDAVNFLSTACASTVAIGLISVLLRFSR